MSIVENMEIYIRLLVVVGKNKTNAFNKMVDKVSSRIKGWSKRLLSFDDKEVFLKAILQSLPTYFLSVFLLPQGIIEKVESRYKNFWWASKKKERGWAMLSWKRVCMLKGMGDWSTTRILYATQFSRPNTSSKGTLFSRKVSTNHHMLGLACVLLPGL